MSLTKMSLIKLAFVKVFNRNHCEFELSTINLLSGLDQVKVEFCISNFRRGKAWYLIQRPKIFLWIEC